LEFLDDSKMLTPQRRASLDPLIRDRAIAFALGWADSHEVDSLNIVGATRLAMHRALEALIVKPCCVLIDGLPLPGCAYPQQAIIDGDAKSAAIAAASIVAKVARDALMAELDAEFPGYGFAHNKGYGTAEHVAAIASLGPCAVHRRSFAPVLQPTLVYSPAGVVS
jgi:ribonuclease HII